MDWYISHDSALEFWRRQYSGEAIDQQASRSKKPPVKQPPFRELKGMRLWGLTEPLHILVREPSARRTLNNVSCHVWKGPYPNGCFVEVGGDLLVSSPEFCFLQMASTLPLLRLIELGFELCGTYTRETFGDHSTSTQRKAAISSLAKLKAFMAKMPGGHGRRKAIKALGYIIEDSASPMETILAMMLSLPYRLGGYGFPKPNMNNCIDVHITARKAASKKFYICDIYWPQARLAVEYDSDRHHTGAEQIMNDSKRRNALAYMGVSVVAITRRQLYNDEELKKAVNLLAKRLGKRIRYNEKEFTFRHQELRALLPRFDAGSW
jgi:hypothetical protein